MNGENLIENPDNAIIETSESGTAQAGQASPEDAKPDYEGLLKRQNETIAALIEQNKSLNDQIAAFVRNTGSRVDGATQTTGTYEDDTAPAIPENYVYLKDLGAAIGSRDKNF